MSRPPTLRLFDFKPLGALLEQRNLPHRALCGMGRQVPWSDEWIGRVLGAGNRTAARQRAQHIKRLGLTEWQADRLAIALGLHPSLVWGDAWWDTVPGTPVPRREVVREQDERQRAADLAEGWRERAA